MTSVRISDDLALFFDEKGSPKYRPATLQPGHAENNVKQWLASSTGRGEKYDFVERWYSSFDPRDATFARQNTSRPPTTVPKFKRGTKPRREPLRSSLALAATRLPDKPVDPKPEDVGLTPERVSKFQSPSDAASSVVASVIYVGVFLAIVVGVSISSGPILGFLALGPGLFWALLAMGVFGGIFRSIFGNLWTRSQPDKEAFWEYQRRIAAHKESLRSYECMAHEIRKRHEAWWQSLSGSRFESELAKVMRQLGYQVEATGASGDGGVDLILHKESDTIIVQCKAHATPVGPSAVRELYGTLLHRRVKEAWLVSTSGFSAQAIQFAATKPIRLRPIGEIIAELRPVRPDLK